MEDLSLPFLCLQILHETTEQLFGLSLSKDDSASKKACETQANVNKYKSEIYCGQTW